MADKKRMNVALTRAKSALYIVAHMDSLKVRHTSFLTILKWNGQLFLIQDC